MISDNIDFRFIINKKGLLEKFINAMTVEELRKIIVVAEKLKIPRHETRPAVDVLFDIAGRLSILEIERISPQLIMQKIDNFLESN